MKVTSSKELENYIYSSVILPLMGLVIEPINYYSPITDNGGREVSFVIAQEQVRGDFRHNFQRDEARKSTRTLVYITIDNTAEYIGADYDTKTHNVRIFKHAFLYTNLSPIILNKFADSFRAHAPFQKVSVVNDLRSSTRNVETGAI